jgi:hypothetical protein
VLALSPPGVPDPRAYHERIAQAAGGRPLLAYHFPAASGPGVPVHLLPDLPVTGLKDSSGDAARLLHEVDVFPGGGKRAVAERFGTSPVTRLGGWTQPPVAVSTRGHGALPPCRHADRTACVNPPRRARPRPSPVSYGCWAGTEAPARSAAVPARGQGIGSSARSPSSSGTTSLTIRSISAVGSATARAQ